jgi:integration host factor subunit beta
MNKIDVIMALAEKKNLTGKQAMEIVDLMFKGFINELKNGGRIEIRGFGSFNVRKYEAYKGRNPKTGKTVDVKPKKMPFFKVGRELKKMVNEIKCRV